MKKNTTLLIAIVSSALLLNCSSDQTDENLENATSNNLSNKSVELTISNISASVQQNSNPISNAIDGNIDTRWSGYGTPTNLDIDLKAVQLVDYLKIAYYKGNLRQNYFSYWISDDGDSWTYIQNKTSKGNTSNYEIFDLSNHSTRYIRLECQGTSTGRWNSISEIIVYGQEIQKTTETTATETAITGTFEINDFDIETSWNNSGTTTNSESATSIDNEEWYDKIGSTYMLKCSKKDGNRTEWKEKSGNEPSMEINKVMEYTTKITSIPENGVTIAQIHNRGGVKKPLVRVYLEDGEVKTKETTSDPSNKAGGNYATFGGPKYKAGTDLTVKIETKNDKAYITITTTDGTFNHTITPSADWDKFSNYYYLKAGVYTEGDDTEPMSTFSKFSFSRN